MAAPRTMRLSARIVLMCLSLMTSPPECAWGERRRGPQTLLSELAVLADPYT
jgi:hypothetical protein